MISHLRGTVDKLEPGLASIDVGGVGYLLQLPLDLWDELQNGTEAELFTYTHVREDRLDLFGFRDWAHRRLFARFMKMSGIGPAMGLELCSVPGVLLMQAIQNQDATLLTNIKGIGRKKAEKLLLDLKSLLENSPDVFGTSGAAAHAAEYDRDAMAALSALGYDNSTIMQALKNLPGDLESTEQRVAAALRSL